MQQELNNILGYMENKCISINLVMQVFLLRNYIPLHNDNFQENVLVTNINNSEQAVLWGRNEELCT